MRRYLFPMLFGVLLLAFALPLSAQEQTATPAPQQEEAPRPFLGISYEPDGISGVVITQMFEGTGALDAGLQVGDVLATLNGEAITAQNIVALLSEFAVGDEIMLGVVRGEEVLSVAVTLGARPTEVVPILPPVPEGSNEDMLEALRGIEVQPARPRLGLAVDTPLNEQAGALVVSVIEDSAAAEAGIQVDDIITAVDGETVENPTALIDRINTYNAGDTVEITVQRAEETLTLSATLREAPPRINFGGQVPPNMSDMLSVPDGALTYDAESATWTVNAAEADDLLGSAGLQSGDVITAVNDTEIPTRDAMFTLLADVLQEGTATLSVSRADETLTLEVSPSVVGALFISQSLSIPR